MVKKETKNKPVAKKTKATTKAKAKVEKLEEIATAPIEEIKEEQQVELEVMNGDPSVATPVENKVEDKNNENPHDVLSIVPETIVTETQPEESEAAKPAKPKNENKSKLSHVKKIFGYFWNGIEIDY